VRSLSKYLVLVAAALALSGCRGLQAYDLPFPGKQVDPDDGYQVSAEFADVVDIVPRSLVLMNDVPVGQVDSVARKGWHASVTMTLRKDIVLPSDTIADIRKTSLLGEKYIALVQPEDSESEMSNAGGRMGDGAVIPLSRTGRNPDVEEVLGSLSFLLARGGVGQLKTISTELNAMMTGRTDNLRSVLERLSEATGTLDQSKSSIIDAMEQLDHLTATLNAESDAIEGALDSFGPALKVLHQQHDDLMDMLKGLDKLSTVAVRVIDDSGDNIVEAMRLLRPTLAKLADAGDALPQGLMMLSSYPFPKESADLARGNYSNALFHLEFNLDKLLNGILTGENTGLIPEVLQICITYAKDCEKLQPLAAALCSLTNLDLACSVVGREDGGTATMSVDDTAAKVDSGPKKPGAVATTAPSDAVGKTSGLVKGLNDTVGGLLGGLTGGKK
jgi:phospholipid/cholesterol/gamma-HCH transport system substrate-binding protein